MIKLYDKINYGLGPDMRAQELIMRVENLFFFYILRC